jgi:hypothetical protein
MDLHIIEVAYFLKGLYSSELVVIVMYFAGCSFTEAFVSLALNNFPFIYCWY